MQCTNEVDAIASLGIKRIIRNADTSLKLQLKTITTDDNWLEQDSMPDLNQLAEPNIPQTRLQKLHKHIDKYLKKLEGLEQNINSSKNIPEVNKASLILSIDTIKTELLNFKTQRIKEKYLNDSYTIEDELNAVSEMETLHENESEQTTESEIAVEVEFEVSAENEKDISSSYEEDTFIPRLRVNYHQDQALEMTFKNAISHSDKPFNILSTFPESDRRYVSANTWMSSSQDQMQTLAPSILITYNTQKKQIRGFMGNHKYADLYFKTKNFKNTNHIHYKLHGNVPLNALLPNLPSDVYNEIKEKIALAKLHYLGQMELDAEEEEILKKWFSSRSPTEQQRIIKAANNYLANRFPANRTVNPLLRLFNNSASK